jgi:hypothetical protein
MKGPTPATIRKVVEYLENELDLSVYGPYRDLDNGKEGPGCMDYDIERILKLRKKGVDSFVRNDNF